MKILNLKILDKIIIVSMLVLSIIPISFLMFTKTSTENINIVIRVNNSVEKVIPLKNQNESKIYDFTFSKNIGYVEVKNGKVRMLKMDKAICPNSICSDTGWIDKAYQTIVCLPNNIVVTIEGIKDEGIDAQAY